MKVKIVLAGLSLIVILLISCNSPYTSRKKGYFHIPLPVHSYQVFDKAGFPYSFEYPVYATIVQDSTYFDSTPENPYWINIDFPRFNGRIYISYNIIGGKSVFKVKNTKGE